MFPFLVLLISAALIPGCDIEDEAPSSPTHGSGSPGGASDAGPVAEALDASVGCVHPDDRGNALGVGRFCAAGGDQCDENDLAVFCSVDFDPDDPMTGCTAPCIADDDCGGDAVCMVRDPQQRVSVARCRPVQCVDIADMD